MMVWGERPTCPWSRCHDDTLVSRTFPKVILHESLPGERYKGVNFVIILEMRQPRTNCWTFVTCKLDSAAFASAAYHLMSEHDDALLSAMYWHLSSPL